MYTYTNGAQQDCYAVWAFPDIPTNAYDIWVKIPDASNPPKPVAKASIKYNIYYKGGTSKVTGYSVDQNYDQGTWKLIKQNQSITASNDGLHPVRVTLGDGWFQSMQYVLLLDAVKLCSSD